MGVAAKQTSKVSWRKCVVNSRKKVINIGFNQFLFCTLILLAKIAKKLPKLSGDFWLKKCAFQKSPKCRQITTSGHSNLSSFVYEILSRINLKIQSGANPIKSQELIYTAPRVSYTSSEVAVTSRQKSFYLAVTAYTLMLRFAVTTSGDR